MIHKVYKTLYLGALHRQRGDRSNIHSWRSLWWLSLSTALYITTLLHGIFAEQYIAFDKMKGEGLFSIKSFDGSLLTIFILTVILIFVFIFSYPGIIEEFKALSGKRKGRLYRLFLLYFFGSFIVAFWGYGYFLK